MKSSEIERSLDNLFGAEGVKTLSRQRVEHELERLWHVAETISTDKTLLSLKYTPEVAELYNCSRQAINTRAKRIRDKRGSFGRIVARGVWAFTPSEVDELRPREKPGRPPSNT